MWRVKVGSKDEDHLKLIDVRRYQDNLRLGLVFIDQKIVHMKD